MIEAKAKAAEAQAKKKKRQDHMPVRRKLPPGTNSNAGIRIEAKSHRREMGWAMMTTAVRCATQVMRLAELQPTFLVIERSNVQRREVDDFNLAHGLMFMCPRCLRRPVEGRHSVVCWFAGRAVPEEEIPTWARWMAIGSSYDDLTVDGIIAVRGGCHWRGRIRGGRIVDP